VVAALVKAGAAQCIVSKVAKKKQQSTGCVHAVWHQCCLPESNFKLQPS